MSGSDDATEIPERALGEGAGSRGARTQGAAAGPDLSVTNDEASPLRRQMLIALSGLQRAAQRGEVAAVAFAVVLPDGRSRFGTYSDHGSNEVTLLGTVAMMQHDIAQACCDRTTPHVPEKPKLAEVPPEPVT